MKKYKASVKIVDLFGATMAPTGMSLEERLAICRSIAVSDRQRAADRLMAMKFWAELAGEKTTSADESDRQFTLRVVVED